MIRRSHCWPSTRGRVELTTSEPRAGAAWTDNGEARESRELKRRSVAELRPVPIPPRLVDLRRRHLDRYGVAADGRLFRGGDGGPLQESTYRQVWAKARGLALTEAQAASLLARRPYDLRHGAASLWLNAGARRPRLPAVLGTAWRCSCGSMRTASTVSRTWSTSASHLRSRRVGVVGHWRRLRSSSTDQSRPADHTRTRARRRAMVERKTAGGRARLVADGGGLENR